MVGKPGIGEVTDVGYKCLITVCGGLEAGLHDRMYDRGWSCARCLKRAMRVSDCRSSYCRVMGSVSFGNK